MSIYLEKPIYPAGFRFTDNESDYIAKYLQDKVNQVFSTVYSFPLIKTYRTFNDIAIPLIDFPCLKVYRTNERLYADYSSVLLTSFAISYIVAFSTKQLVPAISEAVSTELVRLLINSSSDDSFRYQVDFTNGYPSTQFDSFINPSNTVFNYATLNVSIYSDYKSLAP